MISIQELGTTILSDTPSKLYIIGGQEYGIKLKYITKLTELYGQRLEYSNVMDVIEMMNKRHIVPLSPALYVVRYDENFPGLLNDSVAKKIKSTNIIGTLVCLYESDKHIAKIDKYLPEYTCSVETVNPKFIEKYLHSDFPKLDDRSIKIAVAASSGYSQARNICSLMSHADLVVLNKLSEAQLFRLFGCSETVTEKQFQQLVASKNFGGLAKYLELYEGQLDSLLYGVLQTMIELEKVLSSKYSNSELKDYAKYWTVPDIYYMFMHTYNQLELLRSNTSANSFDSLIYLFGLLSYKPIPSLEVME